MALFLYFNNSTDKRTDYPGKKIARAVENQWENNFTEEIGLVGETNGKVVICLIILNLDPNGTIF